MSDVPEMVERVKDAIDKAYRSVSYEAENSWAEKCETMARAAVEAMREPTPEMEASWGEDDYYESHSLKLRTWHEMIAAALGEKP